jgi:hypothetical protein
VFLFLFAWSSPYATASPRVTDPVRIEISAVQREPVEKYIGQTRPAYQREGAAPAPVEPPSPRAGLARVLYQRPPPFVQKQI